MPKTIRAQLLLLMMTVLLPGIAAALFVVAHTYQSEQDALQRAMRDNARTVAQAVDRELARRMAIARTMASSRIVLQIADASNADLAEFDAWARTTVQDVGGWVELHSGTHELLNTRRPPGSPPRPHHGGFALAAVATVLPFAPHGLDNVVSAQLVQPVLRDGKTVLHLVFAVPPEVMQGLIEQQGLPKGQVGTVLDSGHHVLARHPGGATHLGRQATAEMQRIFEAAAEGEFRSVSLDGVPVLGWFSRTPQGWTYATAAPHGQVLGSVPAPVLQVVLGALALLALAALAAARVGRHIAGAVESLEDAALALQRNAPVKVQPTGTVECDAVAAALALAAQAIGNGRDDLQRRVAEAVTRTRQAEQQVGQSQRIAALGRLTGGVAHDFNNLLGVISNSAHLISRHGGSPALQTPVAAILRAVDAGSNLSQQLLRFGARQPLRPRAVDLALQLPELRELLQMVVRKSVVVHMHVQPGTAQVLVDAGELELAMTNLALNARDAMPDGGQLWLDARNAADADSAGLPPGPYVVLAVTDDGEGVDEAAAAHVFEPFFTTKATGEGSGLGLSQVHGFCVQAGGMARFQSTPGHGSSVLMFLPACAPVAALVNGANGANGAGTPAAGSAAAEPTRALDDVRVLLVEDNLELAQVTALLLQSFGCSVQCAHSVGQAWAHLRSGAQVDLVLSDVVMPGSESGIDLAKTLRQRHPHLPVVLTTGYSAQSDGITGFAVLRKPVAADVLERTLLAALRRTAGSGPA